MVASFAVLPMVLPHLMPDVPVDALRIAMPVFLLMLLPLTIGFVLAKSGSLWIEHAHGAAHRVCDLAFILLQS
jgi:hypothetical protein